MRELSVKTLAAAAMRAARHRDAPLILGTAVAFGIAVLLAIGLTRNSTNISAIWPANAFLLAALLVCPRRTSRHALVGACFLANFIVCVLAGDRMLPSMMFSAVNGFEAMLAFLLLRRICGRHVELTQVWTVVKFVMICIAAPLLPALVGAYVAYDAFGADFADAYRTWFLSDSLGLLVLTPALLLLRKSRGSKAASPSFEYVARHFFLLAAVTLVVFTQSMMPLLFLPIPISVLIAFRLGPRYAAIATLWLTAVSLICTYQGWGPAALIAEEHAALRIWMIQLFCFVSFLTSLGVAAAVAERDRLREEFEKVSALAAERRRYLDTALDTMSQGICLFDREGRVAVRNSRFLTVYGLSEDAVPSGMPFPELMAVCAASGVCPEHASGTLALDVDGDLDQQLIDGRHIRISQRVTSDGGAICTYTDITAEKQAEVELLHRTLHDILTGLPNRRLLVERIDRAMAAARRGADVAVMLLDVDHFKSINDNLGHAAGDGLLIAVAERLRECVRETDTVARLGGDEFAILLIGGNQERDLAALARRILEQVSEPVFVDSKMVRAGMSIGIAMPPEHGTTTDEILKSADVALYKAKRNGRHAFAFFDAAEDAGACSARRLESELRRALEERQFRLVYQPIVDGGTGEIAALEALLRWDHPELGTISPAEFIPLAERNGLIVEIGDWVLEKACRDAALLPAHTKVSINLSRVQLSDGGFVERVSKTLQKTGIPPSRIELEVTETAILDNVSNASRILEDLRGLGVSVAIDDFGVGQSALSCLRDLPISRIKIDRSFVNDLTTDPKARSIFAAIASLAKSLGINTTAEGIETEQQRMIAALAGCDHLQGYLVGRPQKLGDLRASLDSLQAPSPKSAYPRAR